MKNAKLESEIIYRNKELVSITMHISQKNELLNKISSSLKNILKYLTSKTSKTSKSINEILYEIEKDIQIDKNWKQFEIHFDKVYSKFLEKIKNTYPVLKPADLKLSAYCKMNLSIKEISILMNLSLPGVQKKKRRLKDKLNLKPEDDLMQFLVEF